MISNSRLRHVSNPRTNKKQMLNFFKEIFEENVCLPSTPPFLMSATSTKHKYLLSSKLLYGNIF
jgi:hypothetical protein